MTLHRLPRPSGPAAARNAGAAMGEAEFLMFLHDDVRPDWRLVGAPTLTIIALAIRTADVIRGELGESPLRLSETEIRDHR